MEVTYMKTDENMQEIFNSLKQKIKLPDLDFKYYGSYQPFFTKKKLALIAGCSLLIFTTIAITLSNSVNQSNIKKMVIINDDKVYDTNHIYNNNPDVSKKVVGSKDSLITSFAFRIQPKSLDDVTRFADLIIIGEVISNPVDHLIDFVSEDIKESAAKNSKVNVAYSQVKVEKNLYGSTNSEVITLAQLGKANSDSDETKVKNGDRMVMLLRKDPDHDNVYYSADMENGLFIVDENKKTLSLSDNKIISRYDGIDVNILIDDLGKAKKKTN